jgi:hypothetical protein
MWDPISNWIGVVASAVLIALIIIFLTDGNQYTTSRD